MSRDVVTIGIPKRENDALRRFYSTANLDTVSFENTEMAIQHIQCGETRLVVVNLTHRIESEASRSIQELRSITYVPILAIISRGQSVEDILECGADICLLSDVGCEYILGHSYSLLRRFSLYSHYNHADPSSTLLYRGDLMIDPLRRYVYLGGSQVHLRPREYRLLLYFANNPGVVLKREDISEIIWPLEEGELRDLSELVSNLRKALKDDSGAPKYIETIYGIGYRFLPTK